MLPASTCDDANNAEIKLIVYPNPATSVVNVQVGGTTTVKVVRLYDALGKQVMLKENSIGTVYSFNVSALASGYYSVVVETSNGKLSKGFTKQ